ncbi:unnamed protein product [Brassica rapa subsp. trilocularis]
MAATSSSKSVHEITELHGHKRMFLLGLQKLGKGDWRGISTTYVNARKPTQVASHAQKLCEYEDTNPS